MGCPGPGWGGAGEDRETLRGDRETVRERQMDRRTEREREREREMERERVRGREANRLKSSAIVETHIQPQIEHWGNTSSRVSLSGPMLMTSDATAAQEGVRVHWYRHR